MSDSPMTPDATSDRVGSATCSAASVCDGGDGSAIQCGIWEATRLAAVEIESEMSGDDGPQRLAREVDDLILRARRAYGQGSNLNDADAARFSVLLGVTCFRDAAWASITMTDLHVHRTLWTDLTRRCVVNTAACASLLAFACWLDQDYTTAQEAVDQALSADPRYGLAHLVNDLIDVVGH